VKKTVLAAAAVCSTIGGAAYAQSSVTLYGIIGRSGLPSTAVRSDGFLRHEPGCRPAPFLAVSSQPRKAIT
jgi:predicted porin